MTPDEYNKDVLHRVYREWKKKCFCSSPGFQKILAFNFEDYRIGPTGCADTEILIDKIIRFKFIKTGLPDGEFETRQKYKCPQCGAICTEEYADYNIHMYRSFAVYENPDQAPEGLFLVGFYGFDMSEVEKINDFRQTEDVDEYISCLKGESS